MSQSNLFGSSETTLDEAHDKFMNEDRVEGAVCPCCERWGKINKYRIIPSAARALIRAHYRFGCYKPFHSTRDLKNTNNIGGNWARLSYWLLITEVPAEKSGGRTSGLWEITKQGERFIYNQTSVMSHVCVYDAVPMGFEGDYVSIRDVFKRGPFNYDELMSEHMQRKL